MFRNISTLLQQYVPANLLTNLKILLSQPWLAIMGRISAYTGKETSWEEMMNSDLKLGPKVFAFGPVDIPKEVPIAGLPYVPKAGETN